MATAERFLPAAKCYPAALLEIRGLQFGLTVW